MAPKTPVSMSSSMTSNPPEVRWDLLSAPALKACAAAHSVVMIPLGATEQHGHHLPTLVDWRLALEVCLRAARRMPAPWRGLVTPAIPFGMSEHHMSLGGTITLDYATMAAVVGCTVKSVARHGFRRIFVMNGHGGNIAALETIITELSIETGLPLAGGTYWKIAAEPMRRILQEQDTVQHACEAETSMIQALYPDHVGPIDPSWNLSPGGGLGAIPGAHPGIYRWQKVETRFPMGYIGAPRAASPEKGEALLEAVADEVARALANDQLWEHPA